MSFSPRGSSSSTSGSSKVRSMSPGLSVHQSLSYTLYVCFLLLVVALFVNATPHFLGDGDDVYDYEYQALEKRPARLSYFRAPYGGNYGRGRYNTGNGYNSHRYSGGRSDWWRKKAVNRRNSMPWENLPNTNCLRKFCRDDNDCCRRYSKCNEQAHVCYDCWYGHPCSQNKDCCEKYPVCNQVLRTCGK